MAKTKVDTAVEQIPLAKIQPDIDQPRKDFDAIPLAHLMKSIERYGIMTPLTVEETGKGGYILVDGERRYRAATKLKLTEVPAIVVKAQSETQRLIQQFHLQEQHQSWTATEKAVAVSKLAKAMGKSVKEISETLAIPSRTISDYIAFSNILDRENFQRSEISINSARGIVAVRTFVRNTWKKHDMEFTPTTDKALEHAIIKRLKSGEIRNNNELLRLKDIARANPKAITKFIEGNSSIDKIFTDSNAKKATAYRNAINNAQFLSGHITSGLPLGIADYLTEDNHRDINVLKNTIINIKKLLDKAGV